MREDGLRVDRSPWPAGPHHTLWLTATARGQIPCNWPNPDPECNLPTTSVEATNFEDANGLSIKLPFTSTNTTELTSTWTVSQTLSDYTTKLIQYSLEIKGVDEKGHEGTGEIGLYIEGRIPRNTTIASPKNRLFVNELTYKNVMGEAQQRCLVTLVVTSGLTTAVYTTTAGNNQGTWVIEEIPLALGDNYLRAQAENIVGTRSA